MRKNRTFQTKTLHAMHGMSFLLSLVFFWGVMFYQASAQGTKGNTITFDSYNSTLLYSDLPQAATTHATYSCYLRHNQAPIQIINANPMANNKTIAALQNAEGTGFFANSNLANNMAFSTGGDYGLDFYNWATHYDAICFAVIAPKGYRFTEYYMNICSNKYQYSSIQRDNGSKGATIMRYTYNEGSTYEYTPCEGESLTLSAAGANSEIFTHALSNAGNILYFKIDYGSTDEWATHMNELRLKYVIDDEFEASIPNVDNVNQIHTGYINLGELVDKTTYGDYYFNKTNVTDLEDVNIVAEDATAQMSVADGKISVSKGGTYWIESPAKFRILGAKVNFLASVASSSVTYGDAATTFTSGKTYLIGNGNGNYLSVNTNGNASNQTSQDNATQWIITQVSGGYTIQNSSNGYYLYYNNGTLSTRSTSFTWSYNSTNRYFYYTNTNYNPSRNYNFYNSGNSWSLSRYYSTSLSFYEVAVETVADNYTATVYDALGTGVAGTVDINSGNGVNSGSVELTGLNNDGVKFTVSGPAAFTVDLTLLPLDPNVQSLEFGYKMKDGVTVAEDFLSASATNFKFNAGETIVIPLAPEDDGNGDSHTIVFRSAYNENRTEWYDGVGSGEKSSNYYLVDSEYEKNGSTDNVPSGKVDADRAGTVEVVFSNIKTLTENGGTLVETEFSKNDAGYNTITLADNGDPQTVYIYSADHPTNMIMTAAGKNMNTHTAYTFYNAKLQTVDIEESPEITITPIYTSSLKGENVKAPVYNQAMADVDGFTPVSVAKDTALDTDHVFYGVTVSSTGTYGYLTSSEIKDAIKAELSKEEYAGKVYEGDVMRTILYVDMSELQSVAGSPDSWKEIMLGTADNCLFFMPSGFDISQTMIGGGIIAGGEDGQAVTDIVVNDQQPFFSPYTFYTSTHIAHYHRTKTNGKNLSRNSTILLPFSVLLSPEGYLRTAGDNVDYNVRFYNLTTDLTTPEDGIEGEVFNVGTADIPANASIGSPIAAAFKPYHITSDEQTETSAFVIEVAGATFPATPAAGNEAFTNDDTEMVGYGSLNGVAIPKTEGIYYFSKNYFWNSTNLRNGDNIFILPYRAYYKTTNSQVRSLNYFGVNFNSDEVTSILDVENESGDNSIFDITGRRIAADNLNSLPRGLYIVNGKKVLVK